MTDELFNLKTMRVPMSMISNRIFTLKELGLIAYGESKSIKDILGCDILILGYDYINTKLHKQSTRISILMKNSEHFVVYTGSKKISKLLEEVHDRFPLQCTIYKSGNTYSII